MTLYENQYWDRLKSKEAELLAALARRDGIEIETESDLDDEVQLTVERELAIHSLDRESRLLREVRAALRRLAHGGYGLCFKCDAEISSKRLNALPWAPLCFECQQASDSELHGDDTRLITRLTETAPH